MYKIAPQADLWYNGGVKNVLPTRCCKHPLAWIASDWRCIMTTVPDPAQNSNIPQKQCTACGNFFPATIEFFHRSQHGSYGLNCYCRKCASTGKRKPQGENVTRVCMVCGESFPLTSEFFYKKRGNNLAFQCKICSDKLNKERRSEKQKAIRKVKREANALPPLPLGYKRCTVCKEVLAVTPEFFHRNGKSKDGFSERCKTCRLKDAKVYQSTHREERHRYSSNYYAAHKEEFAASNAEYRKEHYDELIEKQKQYYEANREDILRKKAIYREENREELKLYYQTPRGIIAKRAGAHNRRALKRNAQGKHTTEELYQQLQRQKNRCYYCKEKLGKGRNNWNADHIVPLSKGGSNDISNIVISCPKCNNKKSNRMLHEWNWGGRLL